MRPVFLQLLLIAKEFPLNKKNVYGEYLWNAKIEKRPFLTIITNGMF